MKAEIPYLPLKKAYQIGEPLKDNLFEGKKNLFLFKVKETNMHEASERFLTKVSKAFEADSSLNAIHFLDKERLPLRYLKPNNSLKFVFCFGLNPSELELNIKVAAYRALEIGGLKLMFGHYPLSVAENQDRKKQLWNLMKSLR